MNYLKLFKYFAAGLAQKTWGLTVRMPWLCRCNLHLWTIWTAHSSEHISIDLANGVPSQKYIGLRQKRRCRRWASGCKAYQTKLFPNLL